MSITSGVGALPGSDLVEDLALFSPTEDNASANTAALLSSAGSSRLNIASMSALSTRGELDSGHWVIALIDSRGPSGEVGIAAMSSLTNECIVVELSDTARFTRALRFLIIREPALMITCDTPNSRLWPILSEAFPSIPLQKYPRNWFNDRAGKDAIGRYAVKESHEHLNMILARRFYALAAFGSLVRWIEEGGDRIATHSLNIQSTSGEDGIMIIDYHSSKYLEIAKGMEGAKEKGSSLLNSVDKTRTAMGKRLLRSNLLQPLTGAHFLCSIPRFTNNSIAAKDGKYFI